MSKFRLPAQSEWTFDLIKDVDVEIARIAKNFGLDTYPNQLEVITSEQMMDAYSSVGMPTSYNHWSFGKSFLSTEQSYKKGDSGLAYEIVINSDPCIAYLMEENSLTMQALVIAHASYGHNSFFKGNYLFRQWTDAEGIIDYMLFAKKYIAECELKYGVEQVEEVLDACHALQNYGVDRYKRPAARSLAEEAARREERAKYAQSQVNDLWRTIPKDGETLTTESTRFPKEPEENILYFIEKHAPNLPAWKREIVRIIRKISQYFYPQRQTQVMNEGWATFWHYTILNQMYEEDIVGDGFMMEFLQSHCGVVAQHKHSRINPYALGFAMMKDIRRISENPTAEDKEWFPELANTDWIESLDFAMRNFKDESFILQYLSPKVMRDFHMFSIHDDSNLPHREISGIHNEEGYRRLRSTLAETYSLADRDPNIQVFAANLTSDRSLHLRHTHHKGRDLNAMTSRVIKYAKTLWGFDVYLDIMDTQGMYKGRVGTVIR